MAPPDFVPPTEAKETGDGERRHGVFASKDIHKGAMIYGKTTNGYSFQRFLEDLSDGEACDFMKFAWPQRGFGPNGESAIVAVMDYHSFMNDGVKATTNCGCIAGKDCTVDKYAQRVIWKGEEIIAAMLKTMALTPLVMRAGKSLVCCK